MGEGQHSPSQPATRKTAVLFSSTANNQRVGPGMEGTWPCIPYLLDIKRPAPHLASSQSTEVVDPTRGEMRATLEHKIQPPAHPYRSAGVSKLLSFKHVMYTPYLFPVRNRVCAFDCMVGLFTSSYEIILQTAS